MTFELPLFSFVGYVIAMMCISFSLIYCLRILKRNTKSLSELQDLVYYMYELRHIPISEARASKSGSELVEAFDKFIDREDG